MTPLPATSSPAEVEVIAARVAEGKLSEGMGLAEALLARDPENADGWYFKGLMLSQVGKRTEAIACFNQALKYRAYFRDACLQLGQTLEAMGQFKLAVKAFEHLFRLDQIGTYKEPAPLSPAADKAMRDWFNKGRVLHKAGELEQAAACFRKALAISPDRTETMTNLGLMLERLRRYKEAEQVLLTCIRLRPRYAEALNMLGNVYKETRHYAMAVAAYRQATEANPKLRFPWANLGKTYYELQHIDEAIRAYEQVLLIEPASAELLSELIHQLYFLCRWEKVASLEERLSATMASADQCGEPFIFAVHGAARLQRVNAERWSVKLYPAAKAYDIARRLPADVRRDGKLRIAYYSSDFYRHATAYLMSEMLERHDRGRFEIYAYSYGVDDKSKSRSRVQEAVQVFQDIRALDDHDAHALMQKDGIDILVDLKGYTQGHRLTLEALRPAPLQVHYLGYPGTTGARFIDYFVADGWTAPLAAEEDFSEALIRLPHSYQINDRARPLPKDGPPRSAYGLPETGIVFGAFNNSYKITPRMFGAWMRIMAKVEDSVIWFFEAKKEATDSLRAEAAKQGIDPTRLIAFGPAPQAEHLARYRHVDLCLDTNPVCGHTTTSDALWCGVPVVAIKGDSFISRVGESLLHTVGLPELIAPDLVAYEELALSIIHDSAKMQRLRDHLEKGRMTFPLFDSLATTRALEAAYLEMARRHRAGEKPQGFRVTEDLKIG